jgi:hypothetical protein
MGIHGQNLFVDAANRIVIAKVSSLNDPIDHRAIWLTHQAVQEITSCILANASPRTTAAEQDFRATEAVGCTCIFFRGR